MSGPTVTLPIGQPGKFKIILLILASVFVIAMLVYSQHITDQLLARERGIVDLYARSLQYISSPTSSAGDFSFVFEVVSTIDFPILLTDATDSALYWKNIDIDTTGMSQSQKTVSLKNLVASMDSRYKPIPIAVNDTLVVNYVHYGESDLIRQLRWLPVSEITLAAIFIFIAYIGFSYIKRNEQSSIWVGMAKETAHQLGTPLSSLMGWLEHVKVNAAVSPSLDETLQEMERDVERLNKVAARFSKIGSRPDLKEENLTEVCEGVIRYIAKRIPKSGKKIDLMLETPGVFIARINRELFEWVIENLAKNALDAMEGTSGKITLSLTRSGNRVIIDVTDTGKGIDPKFHKEVFRPGYSTKKRGWGLGLSLSKRIIEEYHRGKLFVKQSAIGQGTTFRIRLDR